MLKDFINWELVMVQNRSAGGHSEIMENLFKDAFVLSSYVESDYQGEEAFIYKLKKRYQNGEGTFILVTDYFGSCSGCDSYEGCSNEQLRNLCIQLANNSHSFKSLGKLINFIEHSIEDSAYYDVSRTSSEILKELKNLPNHVIVEKF